MNILSILLVLGIFLPSSTGDISVGIIYPALHTIIITTIILLSIDTFNPLRSTLVGILVGMLFFNTYISELDRFQWGTALILLPIFFLFSVDIKQWHERSFIHTLNFITFCIFFLGISVVFDFHIIQNFLHSFYSTTFRQLYTYMMNAHKPVGPFASHSIASLIYYLFFLVYYTFWLKFKAKKYLLISIGYIILILFLRSYSTLLMVGFAVLTILNSKFLLRQFSLKTLIFNGSIFILFVILFLTIDHYLDLFSYVLGTENNGLLSRYGEVGILSKSIEHLQDTLLAGDGLKYSTSLTYTDSGYIHSLLLFGSTGTIIFYILFYLYIKQTQQFVVFLILFSIMFFEIGYDIFYYPRFHYILYILYVFITIIRSKEYH